MHDRFLLKKYLLRTKSLKINLIIKNEEKNVNKRKKKYE